GLPELRRVIVAFGDDVVMEETLELALQRIFGGKSRAAQARTSDVKDEATAQPVANLAKEAMSVYQRAINMQRQGDWQGYGEELRKLEQLLKQLAK
ncbi:MAG: UPF0182 family protein, partial [Trichlorobacter sp.]|nr:UPF0182 family protein [Trichlorobacter sp.]